MTEHYFNALEQKIDRLIHKIDDLERENRRLKDQESKLREERAQLIQLSNQTQGKVEAMIQRLKSLEQSS
ncbi:TIGR02449 family protein [Nitrincola alkalilacustris]|uniref:TIGR02449 family protein n=1 Tax=Nitrincola alkalilacustris TaxID=1571224 RepID=UPI00124C897C|nr:TIGR02449 family protein [Nitrincola alkalilacustris]